MLPPHGRLLRNWLLLLSGLAALAALRALLLPPVPRVEPLNPGVYQRALQGAGLPSHPLPGRPGSSGYDRSHSPVLVFAPGSGSGARLLLMRARVRDRQSFEVAGFTQDLAALRLRQRRLDGPTAGSARGLIQGQAAFQTCLVAAAGSPVRAAITREALKIAVDQAASARRNPLPIWLGLIPARNYSCLLVTLVGRDRRAPPAELWHRLLPALATALQQHP